VKFWDSSALIPLFVEETNSAELRSIAREDQCMVVWWGAQVECQSAFVRLGRENWLTSSQEDRIIALLKAMAPVWTEIMPSENVRRAALRMLMLHPLRAADALQLAAALVWAAGTPFDRDFVCLDRRLNEAARKEGFRIKMSVPE
jgi:uncharacterized protein